MDTVIKENVPLILDTRRHYSITLQMKMFPFRNFLQKLYQACALCEFHFVHSVNAFRNAAEQVRRFFLFKHLFSWITKRLRFAEALLGLERNT